MPKTRPACIYCGSTERPSRDHVPPKTLFLRPRPSNLITVPSCEPCNSGFALDDEYMRTVLITRAETADHPATTALIDEVSRSLARPKARGLANLVAESFTELDIHTPSGLFLETQPAFSADAARLLRNIERIGRGLYFHEAGQRLPANIRVEADMLLESGTECSKGVGRYLAGRPVDRFGRNEFQYCWLAASDNPSATICRMVFFGVSHFVCVTAPERPGISAEAV